MSGKLKRVLKEYKVLVGGLLIMGMLLLAMLVYAGMWPCVRGGVGQHAAQRRAQLHRHHRHRDLVIVQRSDGSDVRTYVESYADGHRTFGDYGDVIVYERYGRSDSTP